MEINNNSNREIEFMSVRLMQKMMFHANRVLYQYESIREETRQVAEVRYANKIPPRSLQNWNNSILIIPPICQSSDDRCNIIEVGYEVVLCYYAKGLSIMSSLPIPIIIGTLPFNTQGLRSNELRFSFEPCIFSALSVSEEKNDDNESLNGESIESDTKSFRPYYSFINFF